MRVVGVDAEIDRDVMVGQCARVMNAVFWDTLRILQNIKSCIICVLTLVCPGAAGAYAANPPTFLA